MHDGLPYRGVDFRLTYVASYVRLEDLVAKLLKRLGKVKSPAVRIPGQGGHVSEVIPVSIPK
jgi:hypothetical protein